MSTCKAQGVPTPALNLRDDQVLSKPDWIWANGSVVCDRYLMFRNCSREHCPYEHRDLREQEEAPYCRNYFTRMDGCSLSDECPFSHCPEPSLKAAQNSLGSSRARRNLSACPISPTPPTDIHSQRTQTNHARGSRTGHRRSQRGYGTGCRNRIVRFEKPLVNYIHGPQADSSEKPPVGLTQGPKMNYPYGPQTDGSQEPRADCSQELRGGRSQELQTDHPQEPRVDHLQTYHPQGPQADHFRSPQVDRVQEPQVDHSQGLQADRSQESQVDRVQRSQASRYQRPQVDPSIKAAFKGYILGVGRAPIGEVSRSSSKKSTRHEEGTAPGSQPASRESREVPCNPTAIVHEESVATNDLWARKDGGSLVVNTRAMEQPSLEEATRECIRADAKPDDAEVVPDVIPNTTNAPAGTKKVINTCSMKQPSLSETTKEHIRIDTKPNEAEVVPDVIPNTTNVLTGTKNEGNTQLTNGGESESDTRCTADARPPESVVDPTGALTQPAGITSALPDATNTRTYNDSEDQRGKVESIVHEDGAISHYIGTKPCLEGYDISYYFAFSGPVYAEAVPKPRDLTIRQLWAWWEAPVCFNCWRGGHDFMSCHQRGKSLEEREGYRDYHGLVNREWSYYLTDHCTELCRRMNWLGRHLGYINYFNRQPPVFEGPVLESEVARMPDGYQDNAHINGSTVPELKSEIARKSDSCQINAYIDKDVVPRQELTKTRAQSNHRGRNCRRLIPKSRLSKPRISHDHRCSGGVASETELAKARMPHIRQGIARINRGAAPGSQLVEKHVLNSCQGNDRVGGDAASKPEKAEESDKFCPACEEFHENGMEESCILMKKPNPPDFPFYPAEWKTPDAPQTSPTQNQVVRTHSNKLYKNPPAGFAQFDTSGRTISMPHVMVPRPPAQRVRSSQLTLPPRPTVPPTWDNSKLRTPDHLTYWIFEGKEYLMSYDDLALRSVMKRKAECARTLKPFTLDDIAFGNNAKQHQSRLLSLPPELLQDIVDYVAFEGIPATPASVRGVQLGSNFSALDHYNTRIHWNSNSMRRTCRLLRAHTLPCNYKFVSITNFRSLVRFVKSITYQPYLGAVVQSMRVQVAPNEYRNFREYQAWEKTLEHRNERVPTTLTSCEALQPTIPNLASLFVLLFDYCPNLFITTVSMPGAMLGFAALCGQYKAMEKLGIQDPIGVNEVAQSFWRSATRFPQLKQFKANRNAVDRHTADNGAVKMDIDAYFPYLAGNIEGLSGLPQTLRWLDFTDCPELTDEALLYLVSNLSRLDKLWVTNCQLITTEGFRKAIWFGRDRFIWLKFHCWQDQEGRPTEQEMACHNKPKAPSELPGHLCNHIRNMKRLVILNLHLHRVCPEIVKDANYPQLLDLRISLPQYIQCGQDTVSDDQIFIKTASDSFHYGSFPAMKDNPIGIYLQTDPQKPTRFGPSLTPAEYDAHRRDVTRHAIGEDTWLMKHLRDEKRKKDREEERRKKEDEWREKEEEKRKREKEEKEERRKKEAEEAMKKRRGPTRPYSYHPPRQAIHRKSANEGEWIRPADYQGLELSNNPMVAGKQLRRAYGYDFFVDVARQSGDYNPLDLW